MRLLEPQLAQLGPARVRRGLVAVLGACLVEVRRAYRAQPGAVLAAEDLGRHRERERVVHPFGEVERLLAHVRAVEVLTGTRKLDLARLDLHARMRRRQAAHAGSRHGGGEA